MNTLLTLDQLKTALPEKFGGTLNQEVVTNINAILSDPDMHEVYRENLVSYSHVLQEGKFKLEQYVRAIKYCSHKMAGRTNQDAYALTFPGKLQKWTQDGVSTKDQASYITAYGKTKLVKAILEQAAIPFWIVNQDNYQKAINTQVELMVSAKSEKVRSDAANSILHHLKPPETAKVELDIGVKSGGIIDQLRDATLDLVAKQKQAIQAGAMNATEVAHSKIVTGEVIEGEAKAVDK